MQIECFGGDGTIEGETVEEIADRFVAHVREHHERQHPEAALRNYAVNCVEAVERLTGSTERLDAIGDIEVHPVSADRVDDWLDFFDHDGFAGNPDWASCYCLSVHEPPTEEEPERPWRVSRRRMTERLGEGSTFGYLAYVDGRPAGWVNASPRAEYGSLAGIDPDGPEPVSVIGVACFVVAPPYRRHGVASALLDRVIADAAARGAAWVEGYPYDDEAEAAESHHYRGSRSMYDLRGFTPIEAREHETVMRLPVA